MGNPQRPAADLARFYGPQEWEPDEGNSVPSSVVRLFTFTHPITVPSHQAPQPAHSEMIGIAGTA